MTAKAAGDAVLVATSVENPGVTGELTVRVSPVPAAPTSLSLSLKSHSMLVTEEFDLATLTVTVKPEGSSQEVEWRVVSGDVSVVKLEGTKLKAMGVGTAVLMVTSRMQPGVYQHFTVTVNAKRVEDPKGKGGANPNDPTPVVADGMMLSLVPNPAPLAFRVEGVTAPAVVRIYDLRGALMHECSYGPQSGEISVAHLPAGIYLVKVNQSTLRLVIQR